MMTASETKMYSSDEEIKRNRNHAILTVILLPEGSLQRSVSYYTFPPIITPSFDENRQENIVTINQ